MEENGITHAGQPLTKALTQKLGPLPGYVYVVGAFVLYLAYLWNKKKNTSTIPVGYGLDTADLFATDANPVTSATSTALPNNGTPPIGTNAQWGRVVAEGMIAFGSDPATVNNAISKYLNGHQLSLSEKAIITMALTRYGQPPEGVLPLEEAPAPAPPSVPPVSLPPTPAPAPAPPAPPQRTYTVVSGDTLWDIARRYYGNGALYPRIFEANRGIISDPHWIYPGQTFIIP